VRVSVPFRGWELWEVSVDGRVGVVVDEVGGEVGVGIGVSVMGTETERCRPLNWAWLVRKPCSTELAVAATIVTAALA
jgi:hypothetical protein